MAAWRWWGFCGIRVCSRAPVLHSGGSAPITSDPSPCQLCLPLSNLCPPLQPRASTTAFLPEPSCSCCQTRADQGRPLDRRQGYSDTTSSHPLRHPPIHLRSLSHRSLCHAGLQTPANVQQPPSPTIFALRRTACRYRALDYSCRNGRPDRVAELVVMLFLLSVCSSFTPTRSLLRYHLSLCFPPPPPPSNLASPLPAAGGSLVRRLLLDLRPSG